MASNRLTRYTSSQKLNMLEQFKTMLKTIKPLLEEKFGVNGASLFEHKALIEFQEQIIPDLPYIGGKANPFTVYLIQTAMALAIYRTVQVWGGKLDDAGELIYKGMQKVVSKYPRPIMHLYGRWVNSRFQYSHWRKKALTSHKREFVSDWVYDFIEGDGKTFSYGIDMYECGIMKFLGAQSAPELVPYLCSIDYVTNYAMGVELNRNETLAVGCARCNFRFIVPGNPAYPFWPPVFPERENRTTVTD